MVPIKKREARSTCSIIAKEMMSHEILRPPFLLLLVTERGDDEF